VTLMMRRKLNALIVRKLLVPESGNRVTYFAGAILQGVPAPQGFGVRTTASGVKPFILNFRR